MAKFRIHSDGGARGNPGPAGIGAVLEVWQDGGWKLAREVKRYIGETTNNQAEYQALIAGLEAARELGADTVECVLDSELLVKQLNHEYRVKDPDLAPLFMKAWNLGAGFKKVTYRHIPRAQNKHADRLVNEAIDDHVRKGYTSG